MTFDPENIVPVTIGRSWERHEDGTFVLPEKTLGYECLYFAYKYLQHDGRPWQYTPEQARLVLWWYALDDDGKFVYRDGVVQRSKGSGKDPWGSTLSAFELLGNCRFSHWDENGDPVGKQPSEPWVQVMGVSQSSTKNTFKLFASLFNDRAKKEFDLKIGKELIYAQGGTGRLETVTSSAPTLQGNRPSFCLMGETHHWTKTIGGHELAETARFNAAKVGGRTLAITNAFRPGQDSVGERDRQAYDDIQLGRAIDPGFMYDSLEAPHDAPLTPDTLIPILKVVYGDAYWVDLETVARQVLDPKTPPAQARRFFLNQIVGSEDRLIIPKEWAGCEDRTLALNDGDQITLGLDGGISDDATALVALRIRDRYIQPLLILEKPREAALGTWNVDMSIVDGHIAGAFRRFEVMAFFSDVHPIQSYVDQWSDEYRDRLLVKASPGKSAVGYDMRGHGKEITQANESLVGAIRNKTVKHAGTKAKFGAILADHVTNTFIRENAWGHSFAKESRESPNKVDGYAALVLAYIAMNKYLESGKQPAGAVPTRRGWIF